MASWRPDIDVILTDSEDEENDGFQRDFAAGREGMLFVIDANLFDNKQRFNQAMEIIRGAFISGMLVNDKELMGIMFANTDMNPEPFEPGCLENISVPDNCAVFLPLRQLSKPIVEHFLRFLATAEEDFGTQFGIASNGGCGNFSQMIRLCVDLFHHCSYPLNSSKIVYMTDRHTPHPPNSDEYQWALNKATDLEGKNVEFHVIPMVDDFDYEVFYKEFLTLVRDVELDSFRAQDAQQLREILADRKLKQDFLKRTLGHFKFSLGPNLDISVQYYNYYQRRSYPRKVKLLRKDNSIVTQRYKIMARKRDEETQEFVEEREVKTSGGFYEINMGNMPIRISPEQINRVRNLHAPGMMLLGFKPKSELWPNMYYLPCNFMYPDDQSIIGSKRLFRALWERCRARDKIAICLFMRKRKSIPRYVALVPVAATQDNEHRNFRSLLSGDGFNIVYLPMAKNIRQTNFAEWNSIENAASAEGVEFFENVIQKLRIKYKPPLINDPVLELLQAKLLALAFDIKTENGGLTEMPDASTQDERIAKLLPNMETIFGTDVEPVKKRAASKTSTEERAPKIAKATDDELKRYDYVEQMIANKALVSCTVAQLRFILDEHFGVKLPKSATKPTLMERIYTLSN